MSDSKYAPWFRFGYDHSKNTRTALRSFLDHYNITRNEHILKPAALYAVQQFCAQYKGIPKDYLAPNFDASDFTIAELQQVFAFHDIKYDATVKKKDLVKLFYENIHAMRIVSGIVPAFDGAVDSLANGVNGLGFKSESGQIRPQNAPAAHQQAAPPHTVPVTQQYAPQQYATHAPQHQQCAAPAAAPQPQQYAAQTPAYQPQQCAAPAAAPQPQQYAAQGPAHQSQQYAAQGLAHQPQYTAPASAHQPQQYAAPAHTAPPAPQTCAPARCYTTPGDHQPPQQRSHVPTSLRDHQYGNGQLVTNARPQQQQMYCQQPQYINPQSSHQGQVPLAGHDNVAPLPQDHSACCQTQSPTQDPNAYYRGAIQGPLPTAQVQANNHVEFGKPSQLQQPRPVRFANLPVSANTRSKAAIFGSNHRQPTVQDETVATNIEAAFLDVAVVYEQQGGQMAAERLRQLANQVEVDAHPGHR